MANRRNFKKNLNKTLSYTSVAILPTQVTKEQIYGIFSELNDKSDELIARINHLEKGANAKAHFKSIYDDLFAFVDQKFSAFEAESPESIIPKEIYIEMLQSMFK